MANVAFRGIAKASTTANGNDATINFDATALPREGDIVFVFGGRANSSDANAWGIITSGYTLLTSIDSTGPKFGIWYKVMGATPDTSVDVEGGGNAAHGTAYCVFVVDKDTVDPALFDTSPAFVSTGQVVGVPNGPAITTNTPDARVIVFGVLGAIDTSRGVPSGFTTIIGANANDTDDISIDAAYQDKATPGAVDPGAWSTWTSGTGGAITIALKPAAPTPSTGSGSPTKTLSTTASGTASQKFNASGSPVKTLSAFASGTATQKFNASGAPTKTLSSTASGTASQKFNASGAPVASLSAFADGTATMTPDAPTGFTGSGSPVATLSSTADGAAVQKFNASGAPVTGLSAFADGTATMTPDPPGPITGAGAPTATLSTFADGDATNHESITASGAPTTTLRAFAVGVALNPNGAAPPPRRKARGYLVIEEETEEEKKLDEFVEAVTAEPLPDVPQIRPVEFEPIRNPRLDVRVPKVPQRRAPQYNDDEVIEVLLQLLEID